MTGGVLREWQPPATVIPAITSATTATTGAISRSRAVPASVSPDSLWFFTSPDFLYRKKNGAKRCLLPYNEEMLDNFLSVPERPADPRESARLRTVLITVATSVVSVAVLAGKPWSDGRTAVLLCLLNSTTFALHILRYRDTAMARLLLFGACLGLVELVADALCVRYTGTLDYSVARSTLWWESPWWMPAAWMLVTAQIGYLGTRLIERVGTLRGALLCALIGAINIPFYEEMAYHAHWWQYQYCRMLPGTHTPVYIVVAELLIGLTLGPLARLALRKTSWRAAALAGLAAGSATILGGLIGFGAAEGLF